MRFILPLLFFFAAVTPAWAIDWNSIGKPLDDDSKKMRDRFVYFDGNTTAKDISLDKPILVIPDIQEWLSQHVADLLMLDGPHYEQQITVHQRDFSPKGYGEYISSLNAAQIPTLLKEQHYTMSAVIPDPPNVFANGLRDEGGDKNAPNYHQKLVYVWQAEVPIILSYKNLNASTNYKIYLTTEVTRIPMQTDNNNTLISINAWQFSTKARKIAP